MVSVNPNPVQSQGFYIDSAGMALPGVNSIPPSTAVVSGGGDISGGGGGVVSTEDVSKKVRKPYTITKSRENWTEQEHDKFLEAIQLFDRDWKKIEAFVGSKNVIQIRSHAQKYFLKVQKSGSKERVPPPRPKRKAAHPYPQKASKIAHATNQGPSQPTVQCRGLPYAQESDLSSVLNDQDGSAHASSWTYGTHLAVNSSEIKRDDAALALQTMTSNCCSSSNESGSSWPNSGPIYQSDHDNCTKVMPDFAQVYSFIGSVFDPNVSDHLQRLKRMDPINVETAILLMRNLSANLLSPEFEEHRKLLSSYDVDSGKVKCSPRMRALDHSHTAIPAV